MLIYIGLLLLFLILLAYSTVKNKDAIPVYPKEIKFNKSDYPYLTFGEPFIEDGRKVADVKFDLSFPDNPKGIPYYIVVDTETTGLRRYRNKDPKALQNWPRIVQFAYIVFDQHGSVIYEDCQYFKQPRPIPVEAIAIHGISDYTCHSMGIDPAPFLYEFWEYCQLAQYMVGHNIEFDFNVIEANMRRFKVCDNFFLPTICTMNTSKKHVKATQFNGSSIIKNPNLQELIEYLFYPPGIRFSGSSHNADYDSAYTARCFWELKKRGIINK